VRLANAFGLTIFYLTIFFGFGIFGYVVAAICG
jgi:hypothetical protein